MAIPHAAPGQVIDIRPAGENPHATVTKTILKTSQLELIRLALPAGKEIPTHKVNGEIVVQCIEGRVAFTALGQTHEMAAGQLLFLTGGAEHSVKGITDAFVLVTIRL